MEAEQKNGSCKWCGEEVPVSDLKYSELEGYVCPECYEELQIWFNF